MGSLRDVVAHHSPVLLIDAAAAVVHAGWLTPDAAPQWAAIEAEAGTGIFAALTTLGVDVTTAGAFVFCEGPGSVLGIRTSAMSLRTWQVLRHRPLFAYRSLELLAAARGRPGLTWIADARKQSWHTLTVDASGQPGPLRRAAPGELQPPLATPAGFRQWSPLPPGPIEPVPYDVPQLWRDADATDLLRAVEQPDAFQHEEPTYATWTPVVHQAPCPREPRPTGR